MKEKSQYYRARKQYLVRLYCDCGGEIVDGKCVKCHKEEKTEKVYPYWREKKKK